MNTINMLSPWIKRFLLEYLISERNLSRNTQRSYRDAFRIMLPFAAKYAQKPLDQLAVEDITAELVKAFLLDLESNRQCSLATRNQRLAAIHALAYFIGLNSPEQVEWCRQLRTVPFKKARRLLLIWKKRKWMRYWMLLMARQNKAGVIMR